MNDYSFEKKRLGLLYILEILKKYSDYDHPLTHQKILSLLERDYGLVLERKAVGRNVALLKDAGYEIETTHNGCYLVFRDFEDAELRLLLDTVLYSPFIAPNQTEELMGKLEQLSSVHFRRQYKSADVRSWNKTKNQDVFFNLECITQAIADRRQLCYEYRGKTVTVSPYQTVQKHQQYFLVALDEATKKPVFHHIDKITEICALKKPATAPQSVNGYATMLDQARLASLPFLYAEPTERISFTAAAHLRESVMDTFGKEAHIVEEGEKLSVTVKTAPSALKQWVLLHLGETEVTSPQRLRDEIAVELQKASAKYAA